MLRVRLDTFALPDREAHRLDKVSKTLSFPVLTALFPQGEEEGAGARRAVEEAGRAEAQQQHTRTEQQPQAPKCPEQQQE